MKRFRVLTFLAAAVALVVGLAIQGDVGAASLTTDIALKVKANLKETVGLSSAEAPVVLQRTLNLTNGVGADQADTVWTDSRTLAASASEDLDLAAGGLTDAFGTAFAPAKIRLLVVSASGSNTNDVVLFGDANSVPFLDTAATTTSVPPGGFAIFAYPNLAGIAVTADTGDIIQVANGGAGTEVDYDILIAGTTS